MATENEKPDYAHLAEQERFAGLTPAEQEETLTTAQSEAMRLQKIIASKIAGDYDKAELAARDTFIEAGAVRIRFTIEGDVWMCVPGGEETLMGNFLDGAVTHDEDGKPLIDQSIADANHKRIFEQIVLLVKNNGGSA
jgi:hypothetical protein